MIQVKMINDSTQGSKRKIHFHIRIMIRLIHYFDSSQGSKCKIHFSHHDHDSNHLFLWLDSRFQNQIVEINVHGLSQDLYDLNHACMNFLIQAVNFLSWIILDWHLIKCLTYACKIRFNEKRSILINVQWLNNEDTQLLKQELYRQISKP